MICIQEVLGLNLGGSPTILAEVIQSIEANAGLKVKP
jgi:hypothetical protein